MPKLKTASTLMRGQWAWHLAHRMAPACARSITTVCRAAIGPSQCLWTKAVPELVRKGLAQRAQGFEAVNAAKTSTR